MYATSVITCLLLVSSPCVTVSCSAFGKSVLAFLEGAAWGTETDFLLPPFPCSTKGASLSVGVSSTVGSLGVCVFA
jgi:hypothetical protein